MAKGTSLVRLEADTGSYERNMRQAQKTFDDFLRGIGVSVPKIGALTAAIGATSAALKVAKDAFMQSETNMDKWGSVVESAKSAYSMFLDTLNGGNWSNFFENLKLAIQGGRDLYDALDRLGSVKANNQFAIAAVQAQIQQLRVLKQQGKNVDDQIKAASARLKALQMEGVTAGKRAGAQQIANTLTRRVRGISGGEGISASDIAAAAKAYVKNGQSYMDSQAALFSSLQKKATYTYTQSLTLPGATSASEAKKYTGLDLTRLTDEERKQYIIAKAITEGETELQQGMSTLSAAVQEESAMWSQQFRNNRYELSGKGGSKGGSNGSTVTGGFRNLALAYGITGTTESLRDLQAQRSLYQSRLATATDFFSAADAQAGLDKVQKLIDAQPLALRLGISAEEMVKIQDQMADLKKDIKPIDITGGSGGVKTAKDTASAWSSAAQAVANVGSALQGLDDPSAKIAGIVGQAVANIALGFAQAAASPATGAAGVFGWIAAATAGLATMVSTIASIKSATAGSYAQGGIVPGNSYSGDNMYGRLNAGELILSRSQQSSLASHLSEQRGRAAQSRPYVNGENIYLGLTNYLRGSNRGELVTTR